MLLGRAGGMAHCFTEPKFPVWVSILWDFGEGGKTAPQNSISCSNFRLTELTVRIINYSK